MPPALAGSILPIVPPGKSPDRTSWSGCRCGEKQKVDPLGLCLQTGLLLCPEMEENGAKQAWRQCESAVWFWISFEMLLKTKPKWIWSSGEQSELVLPDLGIIRVWMI